MYTIIKAFGKTKLKFNLPYFIVTTLKGCEEADDINIDKFIQDSLENHLKYCLMNIKREGPGHLFSNVNRIPLEVQLTKHMALKLWLASKKLKVSKSDIVTEALAFSIPVLLEQNQAREDYKIEVDELVE